MLVEVEVEVEAEAEDEGTRVAVFDTDSPERMQILIVRRRLPQPKLPGRNVGLAIGRGSTSSSTTSRTPEQDQLRKVFLLEYSYWFD